MDPFVKLHEYIHPFILQYMSVRDLLTMSEVSPLWKEIVEKEGKLEKKIRLNVNFNKIEDEELAAIQESPRQYELIDLSYTKEDICLLPLIRKIAPSVTDLAIVGTDDDENNFGRYPVFDFPNLKRLKLTEDADWLIKSTLQIEELIAKWVSNDFLNKLLENQKKLKVLEVAMDDFDIDFVPQYSLQVFRLNCVSAANFRKFIYPHCQTLEVLEMEQMVNAVDFIQLMNDFPQLTELSIIQTSFDLTAQQAANISINKKITHLSLEVCAYNIMDIILQKLPNLTHLKVNNLNADLLEFIVLNMTQLKMLTFVKRIREEFNASEKYEQLKRDNGSINQNIEIEERLFFIQDDIESYDDSDDDSDGDLFEIKDSNNNNERSFPLRFDNNHFHELLNQMLLNY